jgi:hypothetical protein
MYCWIDFNGIKNSWKLTDSHLCCAGSAFESINQFLFGNITMQIKLVPNNSAGTVTAYYVCFFPIFCLQNWCSSCIVLNHHTETSSWGSCALRISVEFFFYCNLVSTKLKLFFLQCCLLVKERQRLQIFQLFRLGLQLRGMIKYSPALTMGPSTKIVKQHLFPRLVSEST